ncbi:MAG: hypothetical protein DWQ01_02265 [Planctomycetota bacterium]|nr:MAG: hypothetical protein DWQ01_02265 [Planctomycetota bacterium]
MKSSRNNQAPRPQKMWGFSALGLSLAILAGAPEFMPQEDAGAKTGVQEPGKTEGQVGDMKTRGPEAGNELAAHMEQANTRLRAEVGRMMSAAARKHGLKLRTEELMITSIDDDTALTGAPVAGTAGKVKRGNDKLDKSGGEKAFDRSAVVGVIVLSGRRNKAVNAGSVKAGQVGTIPTGTYAVRGDASLESRRVSLVGGNGKVVATINVDPTWQARKGGRWKAIYMSIMAHFMRQHG